MTRVEELIIFKYFQHAVGRLTNERRVTAYQLCKLLACHFRTSVLVPFFKQLKVFGGFECGP
jgi:hypothetical protein